MQIWRPISRTGNDTYFAMVDEIVQIGGEQKGRFDRTAKVTVISY